MTTTADKNTNPGGTYQRERFDLAGFYNESSDFPEGAVVQISQIVEKELARTLVFGAETPYEVRRALALSVATILGHMSKKEGRVVDGISVASEMPILTMARQVMVEINKQLGIKAKDGDVDEMVEVEIVEGV